MTFKQILSITLIAILFTAICLFVVVDLINKSDTIKVGSRTEPVKEGDIFGSATSLTSITGGFTGAGSASSTLSWSGGDALRLNLWAKNNYSTSSVEWLFEFSDDGTNWFLDGGLPNLATTTATSTLIASDSIYAYNPGIANVTTTRSYLFEHIQNTKFVKVSFRHSNDPAVTSKIFAQIIKEEQY